MRARRAISTSTRWVCVLPAARQAGEEHERPGADKLDDRPLLVRDVYGRPMWSLKEFDRRSVSALSESGGETTLHLPELGAVDAFALDNHVASHGARAHRRLERIEVIDRE